MKVFCLIYLTIFLLNYVTCDKDKYKDDKKSRNIHDVKDPFRMGKLNLIWEKARKRLSETKLNKLLSELKVQDSEEITLKKLKSSGGDKEGLKEAEIRSHLSQILKRFALEQHHDDKDPLLEKKISKAVFSDKKLNKLWIKAEQSGLTQEELKLLKEEFQHHQDKIDEYLMLISETSSKNDVGGQKLSNDIHNLEEFESMEASHKDYADNVNAIRTKHRELKVGYNKLHRKATSGPESRDFSHSKVKGLWDLALRSNFNDDELNSLFTELKHYEVRLNKLTFFDNEMKKLTIGKFDEELSDEEKEKILRAQDETEGRRILKEKLDKQIRKTDKLHAHLESRILARHTEL